MRNNDADFREIIDKYRRLAGLEKFAEFVRRNVLNDFD